MKSLCMICPIFLALLVGCGAPMGNPHPSSPDMSTPGGISNPPPPTPDKDGSRIRVLRQRTTTSDGLQDTNDHNGYFDKQLNEYCWPIPDSSGRMRCMPSIVASVGGFGDAGCTIPAAYYNPSCGVRKYGLESIQPLANSCFGVRYRVWKIGAQIDKLYLGSPGSCRQGTPPDGYLVYAVSTQVPDEDLALLTTTTY